jgi:hypothetical protein
MSWNIPGELIPIIVVVSVFAFLTISSVMHYAYKAYRVTQLTRLKERLLDAGMTSAEIERVVNAGSSRDCYQETMRQKKAG